MLNKLKRVFRKKKPDTAEPLKYELKMQGLEHIKAIRDYLDYLEEHIVNVNLAFIEVVDACRDMQSVNDDQSYWTLRGDVEQHDISKFSIEEFIQYQEAFYPVDGVKKELPKSAWEHHKENNTHHWESIENWYDVTHMIIDWTAMSYKFGGDAQSYYEKNLDKIEVPEKWHDFMYEIFKRLRA